MKDSNKHVARSALAIMGLGLASSPLAAATNVCPDYRGPLATAEQVSAEKQAASIADSPEITSLRPTLRKVLGEDPAARLPDGSATIERAIDLFSRSLILAEIAGDTNYPQILWWNDNSPRCWFGHVFPGSAISGDNPDHIYRTAFIDGSSSYRIRGRMGKKPVSQFSIELTPGTPSDTPMVAQSKTRPDLGRQIAVITSKTMQFASDGSFEFTVDPTSKPGDPNHIQSPAGPGQLVIRDVLSDWSQEPTALQIERVSPPNAARRTQQEITQSIAAALPAYVRFWAGFKTNWLGGIANNTLVGPVARDGGWGYLVGGRFHLGDNQAMVVNIRTGGAKYYGIQVTNPWYIVPVDARKATVNLNTAQMRPDPTGRVTLIIAPRDPGYANWVSTGKMHDGLLIFRWQAVPDGVSGSELLENYQVVDVAKLADIIPQSASVSPAQRQAELKLREQEFDKRLGEVVIRANAAAEGGRAATPD